MCFIFFKGIWHLVSISFFYIDKTQYWYCYLPHQYSNTIQVQKGGIITYIFHITVSFLFFNPPKELCFLWVNLLNAFLQCSHFYTFQVYKFRQSCQKSVKHKVNRLLLPCLRPFMAQKAQQTYTSIALPTVLSIQTSQNHRLYHRHSTPNWLPKTGKIQDTTLKLNHLLLR